MVNADQLTPEEAKALLVKRQQQSRDRQREFSNHKRAKGYKRINAFLSPRAYAVLDRERERTGNNVGDVLSAILERFDEQRESVKPNIVPRGTKQSANAAKREEPEIFHPKIIYEDKPMPVRTVQVVYESANADKREENDTDAAIMAMHAEGMSYHAIADRLTADGIPTATGKNQWLKGTVGNIIKRMKGGK